MKNEAKKYLKDIMNKYEKNTTDFLVLEEYRIANYLYELINNYDELKVKYKNVENELLVRTDKLREYSKELNLKNRIRSIQDTMLDEVKA